jgi:dihydropteroate synthase
MFTLNVRGKLQVFEKPAVMGIINATPDSLHAGRLSEGVDALVRQAGMMLEAGAAIIDIGGQSTRPGSIRIDAQEEADRVLPAIAAVHKAYPDAIISVDTFFGSVARSAVAAGASIINDISAGRSDPDMIPAVASLGTPYILMHMPGTPETMHQDAHYNDLLTDLLDFFIRQTERCRLAGINDIIVDPGFGFGKTIEQNFRLLKNLNAFSILQKPILAGLSRKRTIYQTLGTNAAGALNGTTVLNTLALLNGASLLRVHDVQEASEAITLLQTYQQTV